MKVGEFLSKLEVWQKSTALAVDVYKATQSWPSEERFGLTSQVRRAVTSISTNIAEGVGYDASAQKARFFEIAKGSAYEVISLLFVAHQLELLDEGQKRDLVEKTEQVAAMLYGLRNRWKSDC